MRIVKQDGIHDVIVIFQAQDAAIALLMALTPAIALKWDKVGNFFQSSFGLICNRLARLLAC